MTLRTLVLCCIFFNLLTTPGLSLPSADAQALSIVRTHLDRPGDLWIPLSFLQKRGFSSAIHLGQGVVALDANGQSIQIPASRTRQTVHGLAVPLSSIQRQLEHPLIRVGHRLYVLGPHAAAAEKFAFDPTTFPTTVGPAAVRTVRVPNFQTHYQLTPLLPPDGIGTLAPLQVLAKQGSAAIAINTNFFDPASRHLIGLLYVDGVLHRQDHARRGAFGVDVFETLHFFNPEARAHIRLDGQRIPVDGLNRPPKTNEIVVVSSAYGLPLRLGTPSIVVRLQGGRVRAVSTATVVGPDPTSTTLIATGQRRGLFAAIARGTRLEVGTTITPALPWPLRFAMGAGPILTRDGAVVVDAVGEAFSPAFSRARAARSALGITADGTLLLTVVLKGDGSPGVTLDELAALMLAQGARDALAFDGGGSASLVFREGIHWQYVGGTRGVAAGLGLVPK